MCGSGTSIELLLLRDLWQDVKVEWQHLRHDSEGVAAKKVHAAGI